jgi:hypothetical protein
MEQENPFYTRKHCEIKRITNVPDRATARRGGAQLVWNKKMLPDQWESMIITINKKGNITAINFILNFFQYPPL